MWKTTHTSLHEIPMIAGTLSFSKGRTENLPLRGKVEENVQPTIGGQIFDRLFEGLLPRERQIFGALWELPGGNEPAHLRSAEQLISSLANTRVHRALVEALRDFLKMRGWAIDVEQGILVKPNWHDKRHSGVMRYIHTGADGKTQTVGSKAFMPELKLAPWQRKPGKKLDLNVEIELLRGMEMVSRVRAIPGKDAEAMGKVQVIFDECVGLRALKEPVKNLAHDFRKRGWGILAPSGEICGLSWITDVACPTGGYLRARYTNAETGKSAVAFSTAHIPQLKIVFRRDKRCKDE